MKCSLPGVLERASERCAKSRDYKHLCFGLDQLLSHLRELRAEPTAAKLAEFFDLWVDHEMPQPAAQPNKLNLDHDEARALHRVVRAMHDGECPKCHGVSAASEMWQTQIHAPELSVPPSGWQCPMCGFYVTEAEGEDVFKIFGPFMDRNLAVFEKWRAGRTTGDC